MLPKIIRTGIHRCEGTGVRKTEMATAKNYFANQLNDMAGEGADFCDFSRCFQLYGPK